MTLNHLVIGSNPIGSTSILGIFKNFHFLKKNTQYTGYFNQVYLKKWGMGLHGVVTCFAHRKAEGFDSLMLHQKPM